MSLSTLRPEALNAPSSGIVEVFDYGRNRPGLIPLWVGEGDLPTPGFISEAATRSLAAGETFYTYQSGLPELRQSIARYINGLYGTDLSMDRFHVTIGGMHALQMALRMVAGTGVEILIPTPAWPNFYGAAVFVQTLSKNWAMTGWRIGWLECPVWMAETVENLVQYSSSGVAAFMQRAAIAALDQGEAFIGHQLARARAGRDIVTRGLGQLEHVHFGAVDGAFYLFFRVDGVTDMRQLALDLVDQANVGLAPGTAFGTGAQNYMRMCFARKAEDLEEATRRIVSVLKR